MGRFDDDEDKTETFEGVRGIEDTKLAVLCRFPDKRERWVPKSQIHDDSEVYKRQTDGKLIVTKWFANRMEEE